MTGRDACTLLLCDRLRLTDGSRWVLYVTRMVICFHTDYERTSHPRNEAFTIVWSVDASLWGINIETSECSARFCIEIFSAVRSRDTEVSDK